MSTEPPSAGLLAELAREAAGWPFWEAAAVVLAIAYLLLAIRQHIACWIAAVLSAAIYAVLMFEARLYMESALQGFYIVMAGYGWHSWRKGGPGGSELRVRSWLPRDHVLPLALIAIATLLSGWLLDRHTDAAMPYLDSFTAWGAVVTTWMVARKVLQNWHYWFVIDSVSIYLFVSRGLPLTALLFALYLVLIVVGYRQWRASWEEAGD